MTNSRIIFLSILIAILLAILVMWCANALAHHRGTTHRHHCGETWNWHRHANWDLNTRRMHMSCGGLTVEEMEWVESRSGKESDCLGLARELGITTGYIPDVEHVSTPAGPSMINTPAPNCDDEDDPPDENKPPEKKPPNKQPPTYRPPRTDTPIKRKPEDVIPPEEEISGEQQGELDEVDLPVVDPHWTDGMTQYWEVGQWHPGLNLVSFPYMRPSLDTVGKWFDHYRTDRDSVSVYLDGEWQEYNGGEDQPAGDVAIEAYLGVLVELQIGWWWGCSACARVTSDETDVELLEGINVLGITSLPGAYSVPSDFLAIDGIDEVQVTIWNSDDKTNEIVDINAVGDDGDNTLYLGQAVIIMASEGVILDMSESASPAPAVVRNETLTTTWGAIKQER